MPTPADIQRSAFVAHGPQQPIAGASDGALHGLGFAVKDLIDVAGFVSAHGTPDRLRDPPADTTAPVVLVALEAGASLVGKTHTDEIACGMFGTNPHFGTPINPAAPGRVPGGSSSGSASAVAAGLCDFALGTDTGGSVRVPASFCGITGIRTTYGRLSTAGVMAMAPSFDSVGWLARDVAMLRRVGEAYFGPIGVAGRPRILIARDAFDIPVPDVAAPLLAAARRLGGRDVTVFTEGVPFWLDIFRPLQLHELRATQGAWARGPGRRLSQSVRERIELAYTVAPGDVARATREREQLTTRLLDLLGSDGIMVIPTAHDLPPREGAPLATLVEFRERTLALTCIASLARLPQISVPAGTVDGCPVGLSFIAGHRGDELLLGAAEALMAA